MLETPPTRPLPPAKARRATMQKSSTPPPAYNSAFTFPSRRQPVPPMEATFHMIGWDGDSAPSSSSPEGPEELLITVDNLIEERERGLYFFRRCSLDIDHLPLFLSLQNLILVRSRQRARSCIRMFLVLLRPRLTVHHICYRGP